MKKTVLQEAIRKNLSKEGLRAKASYLKESDFRILSNLYHTTLVKLMEYLVSFTLIFIGHVINIDYKINGAGYHWSLLIIYLGVILLIINLWEKPRRTKYGFLPARKETNSAKITSIKEKNN